MSRSQRFIIPLILIMVLVAVTGGVMLRSPKTFTETDDGKTVTVKEGETFRVQLAENPTTGYSWDFIVSSGLSKMSDKYEPYDRTGTRVGMGGIHTWNFKAMKTGEESIIGIYKPVSGNTTGTEKKYTLKVKVVQGGPLSRLFEKPPLSYKMKLKPNFFKVFDGQEML